MAGPLAQMITVNINVTIGILSLRMMPGVSMLEDGILHHVAIAVKSLDKAEKIYTDLGLKFTAKREVVSDQFVTTSFAKIADNAHLELLEPLAGEGPIQKFLDKKGEGLHHLCFRVEDIAKKSLALKEQGHTLLYAEAKVGAHNCLVNFIHPKSTGGVLIEISQTQERQ